MRKQIIWFVSAIVIVVLLFAFYNIFKNQAVSKRTTNILQTEDEQEKNEIDNVSDSFKIKDVPQNYLKESTQQGKVEKFEYETNSYDDYNRNLKKSAYIYLPYGYNDLDSETKYNTIYLLHGGGGNNRRYLVENNYLKNILDNMIENKELEPLIVITPTYYDNDNSDSSVSESGVATKKFHNEVINDLIPQVEMKYNTYLEGTHKIDIENSREHRAFGGFSMGSVATWYEFIYDLDYFKYFLPMSGDSWILGMQASANGKAKETAEYLSNIANNSKYKDNFYIFAFTGTDDIAYNAENNQIEEMKKLNAFKYGYDKNKNNLYFGVLDGGLHDYPYIRQYIYNVLPSFWSAKQDVNNDDIEIKSNYKYETKEIMVDNNGNNIYGILYRPITENKVPTIIFSHGFGGTHSVGTPYAEKLVNYGIAFYEFDFRGGATHNKSDGKPTDMSIFTEKSDLEAVLNTVKNLEFVDQNNIFLMGTSQGGMVSAMVSAEHQEEIKADILLYPAFCIPEDARNKYGNINNVPNNASFMGMVVGKTYYKDLFGFDIYEKINNFNKNVLIIHGDKDSVVDIDYSKRATKVYASSELKTIGGAGHGFYGEDFEKACNYILEFLNNEIVN